MVVLVRHLGVFSSFASLSSACTSFGAGKNAIVGGWSAAAQTDDAEGADDYRLVYVPGKTHAPGAMRKMYNMAALPPRLVDPDLAPAYSHVTAEEPLSVPVGEIPQVAKTHAYWDGAYGLQNEFVTIGESTCSSRLYAYPNGQGPVSNVTGQPIGKAKIQMGELSRLMLERCDSARCAVTVGGGLAEEHGFFSTLEVDDSGESLFISDGEETFVFHILSDPTGGSAIWAAQKIPEGHFSVVSNMFIIREMDLKDSENFLYSKKMTQIASEMGWWDGKEAFDFTKIYSAGEYASPYYSARRAWSILNKVAPSLKLDPMVGYNLTHETYPVHVKIETESGQLTHETLFSFYRDHYENTPFDLTKGGSAGPYGNPTRNAPGVVEKKPEWSQAAWERSIEMYRTTYAQIGMMRAGETAGKKEGILWWAPARTASATFVPVRLQGVTKDIPSLCTGRTWAVEQDSLWWASNAIAQIALVNWHDIMNKRGIYRVVE